ncbi:MAG: aldehyde dehydrogenase family protein [Leptolyngbya sp. PLA1]|nr:aldehyde dehydrogenase family protein [Leptolyngbya sp. PLA1]
MTATGQGADLIAGAWVPLQGEGLVSHEPARPARRVWWGTPQVSHVDRGVRGARSAQRAWEAWGQARRGEVLRRFAEIAAGRAGEMASLISREVGKPAWDARAEADLLAVKVQATLDASEHGPLTRVRGFSLPLGPTRQGRCEFRAHGVAAVVGPFNFPAHLPNGHIVPALLMGNTVVFKPSDKAPATGELLARWFDEALRAEGAPPGVLNLVQGGAEVASALVGHTDIDAVLFTGSWPVGRRIIEANLDRPGRLLALEMGGNSAAVIMPSADLPQAVIECVRAAFVTAGQRCTCTRRIILHHDVAPRVLAALRQAAMSIRVGMPDEDGVFMGPLISDSACDAVLLAQREFESRGGRVLVRCERVASAENGHFLRPGVMQVDRFSPDADASAGCDREVFGPLVRVAVTDSLDDAIAQANASAFGLAAAIFTRDAGDAERFCAGVRAGCINVNAGTAGASGKLPFGGLGLSGNHRPAGAFSVDYCAYPVAGIIERGEGASLSPGMLFDPAWLGGASH